MDNSPHLIHQLDQHDARRHEAICTHGWALQGVSADEESPPHVYTVGLSGFGHPELILFATTQATAADVLDELGELVRAGRTLAAGSRVVLRRGAVHLLSFPGSEDWLFAAEELYRLPGGPPVPALLVVPEDELDEPADRGRHWYAA